MDDLMGEDEARCYADDCRLVLPIRDMHRVSIDEPGNYHYLCEGCYEAWMDTQEPAGSSVSEATESAVADRSPDLTVYHE